MSIKIRTSPYNGVVVENKEDLPIPTDLPIIYEEEYDASKIVEGYYTYFTSPSDPSTRGLFYKVGDTIKQVFNFGDRQEGDITRISIANSALKIERSGLPDLIYSPILKTYISKYMCIYANETSTLELVENGTTTVNLSYTTDGVNWINYSRSLTIEKGSTILLKGNNPTGWSTDTTNYASFLITGDVAISGNVMSLLDNGVGTTTEIPNNSCFINLFLNSTGITSVSANFLPAVSLTSNCYRMMFRGCSNLKNAPKLPAIELAEACYYAMFYECFSLKEAPELPATTLAVDCYRGIFYRCEALVKAPELPATTLAQGCYMNMLQGCKSLFWVKIKYTGNFGDTTDAFSGWLGGVPSYGIILYNGSDTTTGQNAIPSGWQKATF